MNLLSDYLELPLSGGDYTKDLQTHITVNGDRIDGSAPKFSDFLKAAGVQCFDTVYTDLNNMDGFRQDVKTIHLMGFDGKSVINPRQINVVHEIFTRDREGHYFRGKK